MCPLIVSDGFCVQLPSGQKYLVELDDLKTAVTVEDGILVQFGKRRVEKVPAFQRWDKQWLAGTKETLYHMDSYLMPIFKQPKLHRGSGCLYVYGLSGAGRTSLLHTLASRYTHHTGIKAHILFLSCSEIANTVPNDQLFVEIKNEIKKACRNAPALILIDDLDFVLTKEPDVR